MATFLNEEELERKRPLVGRQPFPHAVAYETLRPIAEFRIVRLRKVKWYNFLFRGHSPIQVHWLSLYWVEGRPISSPYSLYWNDEQNSVQHGMTHGEVFRVLEDLLKESEL